MAGKFDPRSKGRRKSSANDSKTKTTTEKRGTQRKCDDAKDRAMTGNYTDAANDPQWYASNPQLMQDAASIPFSYSTGTMLDLNPEFGQYVLPGIETISLAPSFGFSRWRTDPINTAAFELYSYVRHANSGSANYDAPDLFMYVMSMANVYSYINMLQRVYGIANTYAQQNRYLPKYLIQAMNIDFEDIVYNLAQFRYGINVLINKASSFAVPANIPLFRRAAFIYSNVYCESTSIKDQLYMYVPAGFTRFAVTSDNPRGTMYYFPFDPGVATQKFDSKVEPSLTGTKFTYLNLIKYGEALIEPLLTDEDLNIMSGDILKAYGVSNILLLASMPEDYKLVPVYDAGVLEQFQNAKLVNASIINNGLEGDNAPLMYNLASNTYVDTVTGVHHWPKLMSQILTTDPADPNNGLLQSLIGVPVKTDAPARFNVAVGTGRGILSTGVDQAEPAWIMELTRLWTAIDKVQYSTKNDDTYHPVYCGSEVPVAVTFYTLKYDNDKGVTLLPVTRFSSNAQLTVTTDTIVTASSLFAAIGATGPFKHRPCIYYMHATDKNEVLTMVRNFVNFYMENITLIGKNTIERIHETAMLSLLNVESIAKA